MAEKEFEPDWASAPGETIEDILKERNISVKQFATEMGVSFRFAIQLIVGSQPIDDQIAAKLAKILGSTEQFWLKREENFRKALIRLNKK